MRRTRFSSVTAILLATLMAAACSESARRLSPAGPTPLTAASGSGSDVSSTSGAAPDGALGASADAAAVEAWAATVGWDALDGLVVEGADVITAVTGVCPRVTITVRGVPVLVSAATEFTGNGSCAGLTVGRTVQVRGVLTSSATGLVVTATHIGFQGPPPPPPTEVEVSGVVASFTGACPTLTMTLRGTGAVVVTSATTRFEPACASVAVGKAIEAEGTRNAAGQLAATKVRVRNDEGGPRTVGGEGTIGNVTGTCPTVTMVIEGYRVSTTATTTFVNGACSDLRPGVHVNLTAETLADGSLVATRIEITRTPGRPIRGDGTVSSVTGTCPAVTMMVQGYPVMTTAATVFTGGTCASIRSGVKVDVTGTESAGVITATAVAIEIPGRRDHDQ